MIKLILLTLLLFSSLFAGEMTQSELNDIYLEAVLFVAVFGTMGIISYVISSKHAKEYKPEKTVVETNPKSTKIDRITELLKIHKDGLLSKKEFEILKKYL